MSVPLTVDVKVGTDWESMTPVTRRDAILAEADEAPEDAPLPSAGLRPCRSCPRSKPSPATCAGWWSAPGSRGSAWRGCARCAPATRRRSRVRSSVGRSSAPRGVRSSSCSSLDDGSAITIHLKMTGQLFVVRAGQPEDPYIRLILAFEDGRELRFRDIRKFGRIGVARRTGADGDLEGELGGAKGFKGFGPEPLDPGFTARRFRKQIRGRKGRLKPLLIDQAFLAGVGNIYADEALWASRLHPLRSAASLRPADEGRLYRAIRQILAEAVERRGSSIDDYTAPDGDGEMQERLLVYQRAGEPCARCGRPVRRIVIGARSTHFCSWCQRLPAGERAGAAAILRGMEPKPGRRGQASEGGAPAGSAIRRDPAGPRSGAATAPSGRRRAPRVEPGRSRARNARAVPRPPGARRRAPRRAAALPPDVHPPTRGRPSRDRRLRHPRSDRRRDRLGRRVGLVGPNGAGKTTLLRIAAGLRRAGRRAGHAQARPVDRHARPGGAPRRGVHGRAGRPERGSPRGRRARGDGRGARGDGARRARRRSPLTRHSSTGSRASAATRWTSASTRRCPGSASPSADMARPPASPVRRRADAGHAGAARDRRRRTCSCSTSRPTTSTSARSSGWRSTSGGAPARSSSRPTTGPSSTRRSTGSGSCATAG